MAKIKGVIFGFDNVLVPEGKFSPHQALLIECGKLVRFLQKNGVEIVVLTNHEYRVGNDTKRVPAKQYFDSAWSVNLDWRVCGQNGAAGKQSAEGLGSILKSKGWKTNETVYVGNSDTD